MDGRHASVALVGFSPDALRRAEALARVVGARCVTPDSGASSPARSIRALLAAAPICAEEISALRRAFPMAAVLAYDSDSSQDSAIAALRAGADDYIDARKGDAELTSRLAFHLRCDSAAPSALVSGEELAGESAAIGNLRALIGRLGRASSTTLIYGETGTGKDVIALLLHRNGPRSARPLVPINCAAIPEALIEGELFGYQKGAFSSAVHAFPGKFRLADGGTLFLDEVGELSLAAQAKILRAIEAREVFPLGSSRGYPVDVRIIAATNRDLRAEIAAGRFRADLFYRLAVIQIGVPPLRDRREDILPIARHLLARICRDSDLPVPELGADFIDAITAYGWPGNARELRNALEQAVVTAEDPGRLHVEDLALGLFRSGMAPHAHPVDERSVLLRALAEAAGKKAQAARSLNCSRMTLYRRLERAGIDDRAIAQLVA